MSHENNIEEGEISEPNSNTQPSAKPPAPQHYDRGYNDRSYPYHAPPPPPPRYSSYPPNRLRDAPRDNYMKYSGSDFMRGPPPIPRPSSRQSDHHEADMDIDAAPVRAPIPTAPPAPIAPPPPPPPPMPPAASAAITPIAPPIIPTIEAPPPLITIVTDPTQQVQDFYAAPLPPPHSKPTPMPSTSAAAPRPLLLPKPIMLPAASPALTSSLSSSSVTPNTPYSGTATPTTPSDADDRRRRLKWGQGLKRQVSANKLDDTPAVSTTEESKNDGSKDADAVEAVAAEPALAAEKNMEEPAVVKESEQQVQPEISPPMEENSDDSEAEANFDEQEEEKADEGDEDDDLVDSEEEGECPAAEKESSDEEAVAEDEQEEDDEESEFKTPAKRTNDLAVDGQEEEAEEELRKETKLDESSPSGQKGRRGVGRPALTERVKQQRKQERKERKLNLAEDEVTPGRPARGRTPSEDKRRRPKQEEGDDGSGEAPRRKRGRPSAAAIAAGHSGRKASRSSPALSTSSTGSVRQRERHPLTKIFTTIPDLKRAVTALQYMIHIQTQLKGPDKQSKFLEYMRNPNLIVNLPLPLVSEISGCLDYIESRGHKCYETLHLLHMEQYKRQVRAMPEPPSTSIVTAISQANRHKIYEAHVFAKAMPPVLMHDANTSASHNIYDSNKLREQLVAKRPLMAQIIRNKVMHKKTAWVNSANMYLSKYDKWKHYESSTAYNDSSFDKYDYDCLRSSRFRNDEAQIMHKLAIGHMMEKRLKSGGSDLVNMVTPWVFPDRSMNLANTNTEAFAAPELYYPLHIAEPCSVISVHSNRLTTDGKRQQCINTIGACANCNCALAVDAEEKRGNVWTDMEKCIFIDKFIQYPKNFSKIASYLKNKTTKDVIGFYYDMKYKMDFKRLLKEVDNRKRGLKNSYEVSSNAARICGGVLHATSTRYFYQVPIDDNTYNAPLATSVDPTTEEQDVTKLSNELQLLLKRHVENGGKETPITHHHHHGGRGRGRGGRRGRRGNRNRGDIPPPTEEPADTAPQSPSMIPRTTMTGRPPLGATRGRRGRGRGRGRGRNVVEFEGTARQIAKRQLEMASSSSSEDEESVAENEEVPDETSVADVESGYPQRSVDENDQSDSETMVTDVATETVPHVSNHTSMCDDNSVECVASEVVRSLVEICEKSSEQIIDMNEVTSQNSSPRAHAETVLSTHALTEPSIDTKETMHSELNGSYLVGADGAQGDESEADRKRKMSETANGPMPKCMRAEEDATAPNDKLQDNIPLNAENLT